MQQCALLILLVFASSATGGIPSKSEKIRQRPTIKTLLDSIHKLMVFFLERHDRLNLDGVFGIRVVQGELDRALLKAESGEYPIVRDSLEIRKKINEILHIAEKAVDQALPEVKKKNREYFNNFKPLIEKPWKQFEFSPQKLKKVEEYQLPSENDNSGREGQLFDFDEEISDKCMGTLLGNEEKEKCDVTTCWDLMSRSGTRLYLTTHQILWFQLGMSIGCLPIFQEKVAEVGGIKKILEKLCNNVIFQMDALFQDENVKPAYQDIFLEKGMICGGMGFMDAVNLTWLEGTMRWQHKNHGCFREMQLGVTADDASKEFDELLISKKKEWRSRNLLNDVDMGNYCSAHKSAVGAGFYAVYTRLFLDPEYIKHQLWPDLYGKDYSPAGENMTRYIAIGFAVVCFLLYAIRQKMRPCSRIFALFRTRNSCVL